MIKSLVVDDEKGVVAELKELLEMRDYKVYSATSGEEALSIMKKENPNIVVLDILMPGMDGIEVLRQIKKTHPKTRVIMLTAVEDEGMKKMTTSLGASGYLTKPYSFEEVVGISRKIINDICREEGIK